MGNRVERREERWRKGQQCTSETGTREPLACRDVRNPGSGGLSARQRDAGKEKEADAIAGIGIGLTFPCLLSGDAGTTGHAGRERGEDGEQEEREEDAAEEEQQVMVSGEEEEKEDDNEKEEEQGEEVGEGWKAAYASSLPSVSSFASLPGARPGKGTTPCWPSSTAAAVKPAVAVPAGGTAQRCCWRPRAPIAAPFMLRWGNSVWGSCVSVPGQCRFHCCMPKSRTIICYS